MKPYWQSECGRHVLYCGDALDVLPTLQPDTVRLLWTDPPYGHNNMDGDLQAARVKDAVKGARVRPAEPIANDSAQDMREVVSRALEAAQPLLASDCCCCCCCCCGGGGPRPTFAWTAERMDREGLRFFHAVVWDKSDRGNGMGWRYRRNYEFVMVAHKAGGRLAWNENEGAVPNIMRVSPPIVRCHPNEKPVELPQRFIELHTTHGDLVLDPFAGSGTTGVACVRTGRRSILIEIEPKYCAIAVERMERELSQPCLPTLEPNAPEQAEIAP